MKKIILSGVALMAFAAASHAQNTATLNQVGSYQTSNQTQSGNKLKSTVTQGSGTSTTANTYNKSITDQSGTNQAATVLQDANANYNQAVITQRLGGPASTDGNTATITQQTNSGGTSLRSTSPGIGTAGTGNYGTILQVGASNQGTVNQSDNSDGNYGSVTQYGTGNTRGSVTQDNNATGNTAQVSQGTAGAPVSGNDALIRQRENSLYNDAFINQLSDGNTASITEVNLSSYNKATITQSGGASIGTIEQNKTSTYNKAMLIQNGGGNKASIEQSEASGGPTAVDGNTANLYQQGFTNTQTSIIQKNDSYRNQADLNQYGNNNGETRITQTFTSKNNAARIDQGGDGPTGTYGAYGYSVNGGKAIIEQTNDSHDNKARIGQSGNGHDAQIYQNGLVDHSEAYIDQYPGGAGNNVGLIKQENETNGYVRITQNQGTYPGGNFGQNEARAYQGSSAYSLSNGNITTVIQENNGNKSFTEQFGATNLMDVKQYGDGNLVTGPAGVYRPEGIAHQEGISNKAYITQTASGGIANVASLYQNGSNNTATITQNGTLTP